MLLPKSVSNQIFESNEVYEEETYVGIIAMKCSLRNKIYNYLLCTYYLELIITKNWKLTLGKIKILLTIETEIIFEDNRVKSGMDHLDQITHNV